MAHLIPPFYPFHSVHTIHSLKSLTLLRALNLLEPRQAIFHPQLGLGGTPSLQTTVGPGLTVGAIQPTGKDDQDARKPAGRPFIQRRRALAAAIEGHFQAALVRSRRLARLGVRLRRELEPAAGRRCLGRRRRVRDHEGRRVRGARQFAACEAVAEGLFYSRHCLN